MEIVDTCGQLCPVPLIMTKKAIQESIPGSVLKVITDNETAFRNLKNYLKELKIGFKEIYSGPHLLLEFEVPVIKQSNVSAEEYCTTSRPHYTVVVKSDTMGQGDDELGRLLLRGFINSLSESERLPTTVILYNSGVKIAIEGTDTSVSLQKLEERGVTVMACGTCVDFFHIKEKLAVGVIGNMFQITQLVAEAGHVVYP